MSVLEGTSEAPRSKSENTRERIRAAALELFAEGTYDSATLREIAKRAGCSLGLTYRYFRSKDDLVLSLYQEVSEQFSQILRDAPPGTVGQRFCGALLAKLEILEPYRAVLGAAAIYSAALTPDAPVAVLGKATREIRAETLGALEIFVEGSSNTPKHVAIPEMAMILYTALLLVLLYWFNDPTENQKGTRELIAQSADMVDAIGMFARLPAVRNRLTSLAALLVPVFGAQELCAAP